MNYNTLIKEYSIASWLKNDKVDTEEIVKISKKNIEIQNANNLSVFDEEFFL